MTERSEDALKACPFCGGSDLVEEADFDGGTYVSCQTEHCEAHAHIAAWNTRAALDASGIGALVEALEKCRDKFAEYAELHRAKLADTSSPAAVESIMEKVMRNREMRDLCDAALSRARATQEKIDGPQSASVASLEKEAYISNNLGVSANAEKRFFIEHGMIHDRLTGKHVSTEPIEFEEGQFDASPVLETCALLNRLVAQGMPSEGPRREGGSGASAPASPVPKECAQNQSKEPTP